MSEEYPIYVLSRHNLGTSTSLDDGHPCCICSNRNEVRNSPPAPKVNPPIYGYELTKFVGLKNAKPENIHTAWGEEGESPELVAAGSSKESMIAVLRLFGVELVQDFTKKPETWDKPSTAVGDL